MKLTIISDTHTKHKKVTDDLPGGDLLLHAGDLSSMGYEHEIREFAAWYNKLSNYHHKVFIAGNHDWGFQNNVEKVKEIIGLYDTITYLQDDWVNVGDSDPNDPNVNTVKIWGSPWQPEFYNWAFNLPRNGWELEVKWNDIPLNTDILVTHGPAWGKVDTVLGQGIPLGCELLSETIKVVKPKIHVCGHIHTGYGYVFDGDTHYFNAAVLDEKYYCTQKPFTFDWDPLTNEINFL